MDRIHEIKSISDYNSLFGLETLHPLISVVNYLEGVRPTHIKETKMKMGFYYIGLKEGKVGSIRYGRNYYDYQEGTLVFFGPDQIFELSEEAKNSPPSKGFALIFHPDLLIGTQLHDKMNKYHFFSYEVNEALHLSDKEKKTILDCFDNIKIELRNGIDKHSGTLLVNHIELLLNYCIRFYERQFITRKSVNHDILSKFEKLLNDYFIGGFAIQNGLPSVKYFANNLYLSPNYLGDLMKKETGKTPLEQIQEKLIDLSKHELYNPSKNISEIAFELGYKQSQHFSRFFKQQTGVSPNEFRTIIMQNN
jgi:AraC-like DNA-binding protein